jgi:hypothetical protein
MTKKEILEIEKTSEKNINHLKIDIKQRINEIYQSLYEIRMILKCMK